MSVPTTDVVEPVSPPGGTASGNHDRGIPSPARLLSAPLPELLTELDVTLEDSPVSDAGFFGAAVVRGGRIRLSMPAGRTEVERRVVARSLLGSALGVTLPPLPAALATIEV